MSKHLFELMQQETLATLYPADFSKREAIKTGVNLAKTVLDEGNISKLEFGANLARLNEVVSSALIELKKHIDVKESHLGVEFIPTSSSEVLNYKDDPIWSDIQRELKEREELLKLAHKSKSEIYDQNGVEVPKVSTTTRKGSLMIKF